MAYEKVDRAFSCPCGKGEMIAEWEEHDVYPTGSRFVEWRFECPECAANYVFCEQYVVRKDDAERHRAMSVHQASLRRVASETAARRYERQWADYVLSLPTRAAMHRAIGCGGYGTFLKRAKSNEWVEAKARGKLHTSPEDCLLKLGIVDADVDEAISMAEDTRKAADALWMSVDKKHLPLP